VRTDGDDECSITILLRSAILIASDALIIVTSPPKVIWEECVANPTSENALVPLRVLDVVYTMRNEALQSVTGRYGSVMELFRNVTEPLRKISILPITN